jgi:hypothetical protein
MGKYLSFLKQNNSGFFLETLGETLGYDETRIFDAS